MFGTRNTFALEFVQILEHLHIHYEILWRWQGKNKQNIPLCFTGKLQMSREGDIAQCFRSDCNQAMTHHMMSSAGFPTLGIMSVLEKVSHFKAFPSSDFQIKTIFSLSFKFNMENIGNSINLSNVFS